MLGVGGRLVYLLLLLVGSDQGRSLFSGNRVGLCLPFLLVTGFVRGLGSWCWDVGQLVLDMGVWMK